MAIRLSDIPVAPARGTRLSDISLFPSGADPDKPLGFVRDIVPPAPTADRVDPKDVSLFKRKPITFEELAGKAFARGQQNIEMDFMWNRVMTGEMSEEEAFATEKKWEELNKADPVEGRNFAENLLLQTIQIVPPMIKGYQKGMQYGTVAAGAAAVGGQLGPQVVIPEEIVTVPGAYAAGQVVGSLKYWSEQGRGAIYREARKEGVSRETAEIAASIGGPIYGWIEHSQVHKIIPGLARIKSGVAKLVLRYATSLATETVEEGLQKAVTDVAVKTGQVVEGEIAVADIPKEIKKTLINSLNEMKEAAGPMALLLLPGGAVGGARIAIAEAPMRLENVPVFPAEKLVAEAPPTLEKPMFRAEAEVVEAVPKVEAEPPRIEAPAEAEEALPDIVSPKLYIGNVTKRMKKVFGEIFGVAPEEVKGFTEKGFPTKRTGIEVTRRQAQEALNILTEDLNRQFRENQIRTESQLSLANAHWGDVVQLRKALDLPAIPRPWKVIRAAKHLILEFENLKTRIQMAVQPSRMFQAGMTVQQVLSATMRKAEVVSSKAWLESARYIVAAHKDLAKYAAEKLKGLDITQSERDRLLSFVARGRTDVQKQLAIAGVEMLAEKADKRTAFIELREEVSKIKSRIGKTMQEKGIRPEYARKLNALIDSFRTTKLSLWRLSDIGSLKNYLSNLKEGISSDPTTDENYAKTLAEFFIPQARLAKLDELSKSAIHLLKAADIRIITTELQRLVNLNDVKNKIYLGRTARHVSEYLKRAVKEQEKVRDNSKIVKKQTAWTSKQKGGILREFWRLTGGLHNHDIKTLVWNIEGARYGAMYDALVEGFREGRRVESDLKVKMLKYCTDFLEQHKITPDNLAKLSSAFQLVFRDPQQKVRKLFGAAVSTYEVNKTSWTMAELMLAYLHTKNPFSLRGMVTEGIASILEDKGALSAEDVAKVTNLVESNRTAKLITEMWQHLAEKISKPAINGVSIDLKGIEIADVDGYTPIERRSPGKIAGNQEFRISLLESQGFLQERTGSKNPIIIRDFFAILNAHINGVSEYVGMAKPFRAAHTILSYKPLLKAIDAKGREVHRRHINSLMETAEGKKIKPKGKIERIFGRVLRGVPRAVLASPGIVFGQISSIISYAATDIPIWYLITTPIPSEKKVKHVTDKFAWAWVRKNLGATSIETRNISATDAMLRALTGKKAIINLPTQGINWMDMKAIALGWLATEKWVSKTTNLTGDAFYEEVNKRAHKAISESQPMFETEHRSILTASENVIARSFVMFRSYVDQTLKIFSRAHQGRLNGTLSKAKSAQMMGAVLAGFVAWKTLRLLIDALIFGKKKDPYEIAKDIAFSPLRALNLVGYVVERQVSRILDIWVGRRPKSRYWDTEFENLVLSAANEVLKATKDFADAMAYYGTDEVYQSGKNEGRLKSDVLLEKAIVDLTLSIGKVLGLPTPVIRKALFSIKKKEKKSMFKTRKSIFKKRAR